jgi:hypothetical protein
MTRRRASALWSAGATPSYASTRPAAQGVNITLAPPRAFYRQRATNKIRKGVRGTSLRLTGFNARARRPGRWASSGRSSRAGAGSAGTRPSRSGGSAPAPRQRRRPSAGWRCGGHGSSFPQ